MFSFIDTLFMPRHAQGPHRPRIARLTQALALKRSRNRLRELDPHLLTDIGVTRDAAAKEADRPIWDAPDIWKR